MPYNMQVRMTNKLHSEVRRFSFSYLYTGIYSLWNEDDQNWIDPQTAH